MADETLLFPSGKGSGVASLPQVALARARRLFFPVALAGAISVELAVYALLGATTALKGSYIVAGLIVGAVLYYRLVTLETGTVTDGTDNRAATKGVAVVALLSLAYALFIGQRAAVLVVGMPVAYGLLAMQYASGQTSRALVPQVAAVFALGPVTKYLTTAFYWGRTDLFLRTAEVEGLLATGSLSGIPGLYEFFPSLHILSAETSLLLNMPPYDGIVIAGIVAYVGTVFAVYSIGRQVTGREQLAVGVCLAYTALVPIQYYTTYFFPQSLAIAYFVYFFFSASKVSDSTSFKFESVSLLLIIAFVFAHHLSLVLIAPIMGVVFTISTFNAEDGIPSRQFGLLSIILALASLIHWSYYGNAGWFYVQFVRGTRLLVATVSKPLLAGGSAGGTYTFGTTVPAESVWSVVVYPPYVHLATMLALFSLGVVVAMSRIDAYRRAASLLVAGVVGAVLLFDTPLSLPGLNRIRQPWTLPFAFVLGTGIFASVRQSRTQWGTRAGLALLVVLGSTAPMAAADDLGKFSMNPQPQHAYSESEYRQMRASADFYTTYGDNITTLWASARTYRRFGISTAKRASINESGITTRPGLFLYRHEWADHLVRNILRRKGHRTSSVYMSQQFVNGVIALENNVYTAGRVEMTHHERRTVLGGRPIRMIESYSRPQMVRRQPRRGASRDSRPRLTPRRGSLERTQGPTGQSARAGQGPEGRSARHQRLQPRGAARPHRR